MIVYHIIGKIAIVFIKVFMRYFADKGKPFADHNRVHDQKIPSAASLPRSGFLMKEFGKILGVHDRMPF